ncbi:MAG: hypothetical protein IT361_01340 [Gemmatimonadaceae bacterium]|nr:hypothetical protein [Gemmatimonadaceae bacterium]
MLSSPESRPRSGVAADWGPWPRAVLWLALAVAPFAVLAAVHWRLLPFKEAGDYAQYLSHAKALVDGRPYGDIGYLYTPYNFMIGPRVQPPGWPLLLLPSVALFGTGLLVPKILVTLFMVGFIVAIALRIGRGDDRWIAVATAAAVGVGLEASFATNSPLSDVPFMALLFGITLLADTEVPLTWRRTLLIGLLGTFVISVRLIGVAIVPAVFLLALVRPRDRKKLLTLSLAWVVLGAIAIVIVGLDRVPFLALALRGPEVLFKRFISIFVRYRFSLLESLLYPTPWNLINDAWHGVGLILLPLGAWDFVRRYWRSLLFCLVVAYLGVMGTAPVYDQRYLWPMWPVIVYCLFAGARRLVSWLPRISAPMQRLVPWGAAAIIAGSVATATQTPARGELLTRPDVQALFEWVRGEAARSPDPMRVLFITPRVLTLETGVPAMGFFWAKPEDVVSEFARVRLTHVITGSIGLLHPSLDGLETLMQERKSSFEPVFENGDFTVYRLRDLYPPLPTQGS